MIGSQLIEIVSIVLKPSPPEPHSLSDSSSPGRIMLETTCQLQHQKSRPLFHSSSQLLKIFQLLLQEDLPLLLPILAEEVPYHVS